MIDRSHDLPVARQGAGIGHQPGQRLLPAASGCGDRSRRHAPDRRTAPELPVRRRAGCCAILLAGEGFAVEAPARRDADEAHRDRGAVSPAEHVQTGARSTRFTRTLLRKLAVTRPDQVWAMDITYIPMARGFVYLAVVARLVQPPGSGLAAVDHDGGRRSASRRWRKLCRVTAHRRSSTPIRAVSSPVPSSPARCSPRGSPSAWTAKGRGVTTSSSSGCGERSNTRRVYLRAYDTQ